MSASRPILLFRLIPCKSLRRVEIAPPAFQLHANHDRNLGYGCNSFGSDVYGNGDMRLNTSSRKTSAFTSQNTAFSTSRSVDQNADTQTAKKRSQHTAICESGPARQVTSVDESSSRSTQPLPDCGRATEIDQGVPFREKNQSASSVMQQKMRHCMRLVPQAAAIVTATDVSDTQNPWRGATVSSFSTVTFEPEIVVYLNLKLPSATFDAIRLSKRFDINMMKANAMGADTAARFAKGHLSSPFADPGTEICIFNRHRSGGDCSDIPPVLHPGTSEESPVAFTLSCVCLSERTFELGDHVVIFGIVTRVPAQPDIFSPAQTGTCLAYVDGSFGRVQPLPKEAQDGFPDQSASNDQKYMLS